MPIEAVFLGLDVAKGTSGVSLLIPDYGFEGDEPFTGKYVLLEAGEVKTQEERHEWVEKLWDAAEDHGLCPVVVAETWDPPVTRKVRGPDGNWMIAMDQRWNFKTILGMGEGWGLWQAEILAAELPIVHRVTPNTWRDALFGTKREKSTEACKATAKRTFEGLFGYAVSDDIAEGAMLSLYGATKCPEIEEAVAKEIRLAQEEEEAEMKAKSKAKTKAKAKKTKKSA